MDRNVGTTDRQLRTALGALTGAGSLVTLAGIVSAPALLSPMLGVIALILLATAFTGACPLYSLIGVDTCPAQSEATR